MEQYANYIQYDRHTATVRLPPETYIHTIHTTQNILIYGHVAALHVFADGRQSSKHNFNAKLQKLSQVHTFLHLTKTVTHLILSGLVTSTCTRCLLLTKPGAN